VDKILWGKTRIEMLKGWSMLALLVDSGVLIFGEFRTKSRLVFYRGKPNTGKVKQQSAHDVDALQTI
jgi:hypothetical protein